MISEWREDSPFLPDQIVFEVHDWMGVWHAHEPENRLDRLTLSVLEVATTFMHLANLGYATVANEFSTVRPGACGEFSMVRVEEGAAGASRCSSSGGGGSSRPSFVHVE